jgi:O-succinylbenzoic acid--CoA ligase
MLTAESLVASATSTHEVLGGAGRWLLVLPAYHVAGLQVLVRSVVGGTTPEVLDLEGGFDVAGFARATERMAAADRRYTALVPTQLTRLLDDPAGIRALRAHDAVLVGGAATSAADRERARHAGVRIVTTYGMSETAGGCVYDGLPLPVSEVHIDNDHHVVLGGATISLGYLGQPRLTADAFMVDSDGVRWFRTDDLGAFDDDGRLEIRGRADDLINTGGLKVAPGPVEDAIVRFVPGVLDAVVVGSAHVTWGEAVSAAVTLRRGTPTPTLRDARAALRGVVPDHALPHRLLVLDTIPQRGPGKPDRRALVAAFGETL